MQNKIKTILLYNKVIDLKIYKDIFYTRLQSISSIENLL